MGQGSLNTTQVVTVTTAPSLTDKFGPRSDPWLIPVAGLAKKTGIKRGPPEELLTYCLGWISCIGLARGSLFHKIFCT
jgi:hypothetical protein